MTGMETGPRPKVALATCTQLPEPDPDEALLLAALRARGATARMLAWDGPEAPDADELVVVRSTWNYHHDVDRFLAWVETVPRLVNPASVIRANVRKTYLRDLEARGIAIVPTAWDTSDVAGIMRERAWDDIVIKPVVSGGSFATRRFGSSESRMAQAFVDEAGRPMMVQRWAPAVATSGERAVVWIDGVIGHTVRKSPRLAGEDESVTTVPVADDERAFAERVLEASSAVDEGILYARIDMVRDESDDGTGPLRLMELELVEPSLFLLEDPAALDRFANAIVRAIG